MLTKSFCYNVHKVKAIVLGADPTNFSDHGKPVPVYTAFGIGSGDNRYFEPIRKNLECVGLGILDVYVQNLIPMALEDETAKNVDWEKHAEYWLPHTLKEFNRLDLDNKIPVLVTAERIMKFLYDGENLPSAKAFYSGAVEIPIPVSENKLGHALIPFYRHHEYYLAKQEWEGYQISIRSLLGLIQLPF